MSTPPVAMVTAAAEGPEGEARAHSTVTASEKRCREWQTLYSVVPQKTWGTLPDHLSASWRSSGCDGYNYEVKRKPLTGKLSAVAAHGTVVAEAAAGAAAGAAVGAAVAEATAIAVGSGAAAAGEPMSWWEPAMIEGHAIQPSSPFAKRMFTEWKQRFLTSGSAWPGQTVGAPRPPAVELSAQRRDHLARIVKPLRGGRADPTHCPELATVLTPSAVSLGDHKRPFVDAWGNVWKEELILRLVPIFEAMDIIWWVGQGNMFMITRGDAAWDDDLDIAFIPRLTVEPMADPWLCKEGSFYCSASELSSSPFLAELERRLGVEFGVAGRTSNPAGVHGGSVFGKPFTSFQHRRDQVYASSPHRGHDGGKLGDSPGHIILHAPKFKVELAPAMINPVEGHMLHPIFVGCGPSYGKGYPCTVFPLSIVFPLRLARLGDIELPMPGNPAAFGVADANGEYNAAGYKPGEGQPCLLDGNSGGKGTVCISGKRIRERVAIMKKLDKCGYVTMLSLVSKLQPAFAPGVECYTSCETYVSEVPVGV